MGFSNGQGKQKVKQEFKPVKGEKGDRGIGFSLTADQHYNIKNKRLTNVFAPVDNSDATTKKFVTDLLKNKAGTTYVNNELAKKANVTDVQTALGDKLEASDLNVINNTLTVHQNNKAEKSYVDNQLAGKVNLADFNTALNLKGNASDITNLSNSVNSLMQNKTDRADFNALVQNINNYITFPKPKVTIHAEEHGQINANSFEWSFGNGGGDANYGFPIPVTSRILYASISSTSGNTAPALITVSITVNGNESGYTVNKPHGSFSGIDSYINNPLELYPGDRLNFKSKTSNSSVTYSIISLIIELDL